MTIMLINITSHVTIKDTYNCLFHYSFLCSTSISADDGIFHDEMTKPSIPERLTINSTV